MKNRYLIWQSLMILFWLTTPLYGKVSGFKEVTKQKYDTDVWHTYKHAESGLEVIWIENEDTNKAFTIGVKTPTTNDTGVNHIIEHTVFTGSEAYPSPSVFFDASEAYPNTYMNALTSGDMTIFPFSTPYLSCYNHLRDIYLDAVFKPKLLQQPYGFYEEGFHSVPQEGRCGGVVYNEMKGAYSSVDRAIYRTLREMIYADSHYAYDSGGAPNAIPTLTYNDFVETYKRYYYPANMKIIVYGDVPIEETLCQILPYLQGKKAKDSVDLSVDQINSYRTGTYAVLPTQDKACLVKAFVLKEGATAEQLQSLDLWMSAYLMSSQAYFQNSLLSLGIHGKWLKDDDVPYPVYAIAIMDIPCEKVERYSKILDHIFEETPKHLSRNAFLEQDILKEAKWASRKQESSNNRGISIAQSILDGWSHNKAENQYYLVRDQLKKMNEMDSSISKLLFDEAARYTLTLLPGTYEVHSPENLTTISSEEWQKIYDQIEKWQSDKGGLQPVELNELVLNHKVFPTITQKSQYWEMETRVKSDLARSQLYLNTSHIAQEELPYLYLYSYLLEESAKDITPFSGIISSQCTAYPLKKGYWPCFRICITTQAEEKEHGVLFEQARRYLLNRPDVWYRQKLIELTLGMKNASQNNVLGTLSYMTLGSEDERGAYLYQQSYPFYIFCQKLVAIKHTAWVQHIRAVDQQLYHTGGTILATAIPEKGKNDYAKSWEKVLDTLPSQPNLKGHYQFEVPEGTYVITHHAAIDHCYINLFKPEGIDGTDYLLAAYLTKHYLNPELRVKMGAYGAGCQIYDLRTIGIYTYRDPDYRSSLPIIKNSSKFLCEEIDEDTLALSKAEAMSKVHNQYRLLASPLDQSSMMEHLILWGKTPNMIIKLQKEIVLSTPESIVKKQKNYEKMLNEGKTAIMTQKNYSGEQNFTIYRY